MIAFQYNPDTLSRTLQVQGAADGGERAEAFRLAKAAVETLKVHIELDATDALERGDSAAATGVHGPLAALESLVNPAVTRVLANAALLTAGTLEIVPPAPVMTLFIWGARRVLPVRLTELSVIEEAHDAQLNPPARQGLARPARALVRRPADRPPGLPPLPLAPDRQGDPRPHEPGQRPRRGARQPRAAHVHGVTMFDPESRYHDLETAQLTTREGRRVAYKRRRFLPQGATLPLLAEVTVRAGDRLDLLAAKALGDPAQYWRLCDANDAMNPATLTATPGATLRIAVPQP